MDRMKHPFDSKNPRITRSIALALLVYVLFLISACTGIPQDVEPVKGFDLNRYLGKWYEIARLDHSFERGMVKVSADYSLREDGGVRVVNKGYRKDKNEWKQAEGKAYFVRSPDEGFLKVSFFGPFYGSYIIFELDKDDYQYAFVSGPDKSYLWFLSRTQQVSSELMQRFITRSRALGFDVDQLIVVDQQ
jgi:apolipoprotein D and lipocalin family protein